MDSDDAPVLIDIRSADERGSEMIPGSLHVPLDANFASNIEALDTATDIFCTVPPVFGVVGPSAP